MKKTIIKTLLIFSIIASPANVYAQDAVKVKTGDMIEAPYNGGTLLKPQKAKEVENELIDKDNLKKQNDSLNISVGLYKQNQQILMDQNKMLLQRDEDLTKTVNDTRTTSTVVKVGLFILGAAFMYGAIEGASKIRK